MNKPKNRFCVPFLAPYWTPILFDGNGAWLMALDLGVPGFPDPCAMGCLGFLVLRHVPTARKSTRNSQIYWKSSLSHGKPILSHINLIMSSETV